MAYEMGEKIRELRKAAGISQDQLAELASLNRVTIAKYESGRVEPGAQALSRIADALDVSVDALLGKTQDETAVSDRPKTPEARIISVCIDKMSKEDRERALALMKAVYSDYFASEEGKMA